MGYRDRCHPLQEYQYGLWRNVHVAYAAGWLVHVYHDGTVDRLLDRFRAFFPSNALQCVRVNLAPDLRGRRYAGCMLRLLAADDPHVDVFLSRDLDDALHPVGLQMVVDRWLTKDDSRVHTQSEHYDTPHRTNMMNLGWYGQKNRSGNPSLGVEVARFLRSDPTGTDYYTADEAFLTDIWVPLLKRQGCAGRIARLPSHAFRRCHGRHSPAYAAFLSRRLPAPGLLGQTDRVVNLG